MQTVAKIIGITFAVCLTLLALLFVVIDALRFEEERDNKHFHMIHGCKQVCCEPNCKDQE